MTMTETAATETQDKTAQCGESYLTAKGREKTCIKSRGHKGVHSDRVVTHKEYKPVSASVFESYEAVPGEETVEYGGGRRDGERSDEQKLCDQHVKDAHESWKVAGKPKAFNDMPRKRYMLKPGDVETVKMMLRRAARLHNVAVRIAPPKKHVKGNVMLYWAATDLNKRDSTS